MRQGISVGKIVLAVFSLLLAILIWGQGLQESFSRPSVVPKLSLRQQEIAFLASPAVPSSLKPLLVGSSPQEKLKKAFLEIPIEKITERDRLVLAALEPAEKRSSLLNIPFDDDALASIQNDLLASSEKVRSSSVNDLKKIKKDPLLYQVACFALNGNREACIDFKTAKLMAFRLIFSQGVPAVAVLFGIGLLIRQIWLLLRNQSKPWPLTVSIPLSLIDMVLLVAGGFVVLGEVFLPAFVSPISETLTKEISSPLRESLRVLIGYTTMTVPPLVILRQQLSGLKDFDLPDGGWLQWRLRPIAPAFVKAATGWVMVMPLVLLTSWLMNSFVGDQGGSNPLLELVLSSKESFPLILLLLTTVVFAPLFEELVFRGTLLPVLVLKLGRSWGVIVSALVFALAHLSVGEFPPLVVLGLGLAFLRLSSGRLFPCVLMHSLWNGVTFVNLLLLA